MGVTLKKISPVIEDLRGVCVWIMPDGSVLGDDEGNILSLGGELYNLVVEGKMREAAIYWAGLEAGLGEPKWIAGARQVTDEERSEQEDRLQAGLVPDEIDEARQVLRR
jgi:hypothetical protein